VYSPSLPWSKWNMTPATCSLLPRTATAICSAATEKGGVLVLPDREAGDPPRREVQHAV